MVECFAVIIFFSVIGWLVYIVIKDDTPIYGPRHVPARPSKGYIPTKPSKGYLDTDEPYNPFSNKTTPIIKKVKKDAD